MSYFGSRKYSRCQTFTSASEVQFTKANHQVGCVFAIFQTRFIPDLSERRSVPIIHVISLVLVSTTAYVEKVTQNLM